MFHWGEQAESPSLRVPLLVDLGEEEMGRYVHACGFASAASLGTYTARNWFFTFV